MKIKKILVSQPRPTAEKSPYFDLEEKFGVQVVFRPFIKVVGLSSKEFRQTKVPITEHTAVIFTARTAVDHYFRLCKELRFNVPDTMKYFCQSEIIANYLQRYIIYRKRKIFFSPTGHIEDLAPFINKHSKENFLYPTSDVHDSKQASVEQFNIKCTTAVMYRTVNNDFGPDEVFDYDVIAFFTPAGIKSLLDNFPNFEQGDIAIGGMGNKTIDEIKREGLRLDITTSPDAPSMAAAIGKYVEAHLNDPEKPRRTLLPIAAIRKAQQEEEERKAREEAERVAQEKAERIAQEAKQMAEEAKRIAAEAKKKAAARKAAATRKHKAEEAAHKAAEEAAAKRSEAARKAAATRRRKAEEAAARKAAEEAAAAKRSEAARKAAATRRRKAEEARKAAEAAQKPAAKIATKKK